ncbi:hypothetical protein GOHSU_08_00560 [Gordonia hirsuta DSM 44140 = NBRC 16056]|uniref:Uncharacterized protein n=1 Tax=Gordonia hirsuta DSM 44140 = NBRC 16056 TaxID=1121927 RepID=L7L936_9ACTN|nr:hypothetical protein [Gordonia hirsuta]GAC56528.1 hypothetical protein GOHSU_08_00560 [Gordonia hirsuta DSM 44140 = NBRC 16056]
MVFLLMLLVIIGILVVLWIISAKTYVSARTQSGAVLAAGTSPRERPAAEEMYALIVAESMAARERLSNAATAVPPPAPTQHNSRPQPPSAFHPQPQPFGPNQRR